jgi:hypothetical protein
MVGEDLPHHVGGDAEEVRPALKVRLTGIDEAEVSLVDESGGLERVPDPFLSQVVSGELAQFRVYLRKKPIEGSLIALSQIL